MYLFNKAGNTAIDNIIQLVYTQSKFKHIFDNSSEGMIILTSNKFEYVN